VLVSHPVRANGYIFGPICTPIQAYELFPSRNSFPSGGGGGGGAPKAKAHRRGYGGGGGAEQQGFKEPARAKFVRVHAENALHYCNIHKTLYYLSYMKEIGITVDRGHFHPKS
jgi:hypothetical protein